MPVRAQQGYPAIGFAAQTLSMMQLGSRIEGERLCKRVQGAFKNPDDMRGFRLELSIATHFARRGHRLQWPEMTGDGRFDLLVPDVAEHSLEVECKSVSEDKGLAVHRVEAIAFESLVTYELGSIRKTLRVGLAVVLTVPGRLGPHAR